MSNIFLYFDSKKGAIVFTKDCPQYIREEIIKHQAFCMTRRCSTVESQLAASVEKRPDGTRIGQYICQKIGLDNLHKIDNKLLIEKLAKR